MSSAPYERLTFWERIDRETLGATHFAAGIVRWMAGEPPLRPLVPRHVPRPRERRQRRRRVIVIIDDE